MEKNQTLRKQVGNENLSFRDQSKAQENKNDAQTL